MVGDSQAIVLTTLRAMTPLHVLCVPLAQPCCYYYIYTDLARKNPSGTNNKTQSHTGGQSRRRKYVLPYNFSLVYESQRSALRALYDDLTSLRAMGFTGSGFLNTSNSSIVSYRVQEGPTMACSITELSKHDKCSYHRSDQYNCLHSEQQQCVEVHRKRHFVTKLTKIQTTGRLFNPFDS